MIPIVFSTDHNYVMPTSITILSMLKNSHGTHYDIIILISKDVTGYDRDAIQEEIRIADPASTVRFITMGSEFENCHEIRGISFPTYYRLLIPWLLPQYDKVIYCDVDVVVQNSLNAAYDTCLDDCYIAGVNTPGCGSTSFQNHCTKYNLQFDKYVNGGFLVMNAKKMRDDNLKDLFLNHMQNKYIYQDQDIINIVCKGKIKLISRIWNYPVFHSKKVQMIAEETPVIIHYAGAKPWKTFTQYWREWWSTYKDSVFYDDDYYFASENQILKELALSRMPLKNKFIYNLKRLLH